MKFGAILGQNKYQNLKISVRGFVPNVSYYQKVVLEISPHHYKFLHYASVQRETEKRCLVSSLTLPILLKTFFHFCVLLDFRVVVLFPDEQKYSTLSENLSRQLFHRNLGEIINLKDKDGSYPCRIVYTGNFTYLIYGFVPILFENNRSIVLNNRKMRTIQAAKTSLINYLHIIL